MKRTFNGCNKKLLTGGVFGNIDRTLTIALKMLFHDPTYIHKHLPSNHIILSQKSIKLLLGHVHKNFSTN